MCSWLNINKGGPLEKAISLCRYILGALSHFGCTALLPINVWLNVHCTWIATSFGGLENGLIATSSHILVTISLTAQHRDGIHHLHHRYQNCHNGSLCHMQSWLPLTIRPVLSSPLKFLVQQFFFEIEQEFIVFNDKNLFTQKIQNILNKKRVLVQAPKPQHQIWSLKRWNKSLKIPM